MRRPDRLGFFGRAWVRFYSQRANRVYVWVFGALFVLSLLAECIANESPLILRFDGRWHVPVVVDYLETDFGGDFASTADYRDPYVQDLLRAGDGWWLMPPVGFSAQTINYALDMPAPSPPTRVNILGTDDQGRDVFARLIICAQDVHPGWRAGCWHIQRVINGLR